MSSNLETWKAGEAQGVEEREREKKRKCIICHSCGIKFKNNTNQMNLTIVRTFAWPGKHSSKKYIEKKKTM